ncbi:uncharacterized protein RCC_05442 [Ramularia collo-cygni]|uniref:Alternative oxidase n=1 Tax=Ramularia collo-cygni TaxID=112498 RepID=A0A2D3UT82_9PEZI|nr:uncharacterized protein RCC_05442 [Ramularia collo-cygni]CZT19591.1 uncharacterized protein RCC_05442 [Ramularia collo-cygni]
MNGMERSGRSMQGAKKAASPPFLNLNTSSGSLRKIQAMHLYEVKGRPPIVYVAFLVITLLPLYYGSYRYRLRHPYGGATISEGRVVPQDFIHEWLDVHVIEPYSASPLSNYCNRTEWRPNLVFNLANANGGIGNVRGNILDFVFFAIEAGASIVLPGMAVRSQDDLSNVWADRASFDALFDEEWFLRKMKEACPRMQIYKPEPGMEVAPALEGNYLPSSRRMDESFDNTKDAYLAHLDGWLQSKPNFEADKLVVVNLERTLWEIDTWSLPVGFRRNFGQLLRVNPSACQLAALAVQNLALGYGIPLDPRTAIPKNSFYGAHLRTEADAANAGWLNAPNANFSAQTDAYIQQASKHNLGLIYAASGDPTDLGRFKAKAAAHSPPVQVVTKFDLLPPSGAAILKEMTWDQQALVDFEVLKRCSLFGGFVKSSFSYNIGMARYQWLEDQGKVVDPWMVTHSMDGVAFDDGLSRMLGRDAFHEQRIPRGMWP